MNESQEKSPARKAVAAKKRRSSEYASKTFDYSMDFHEINFRERPNLYQIGVGEQGVLLVEPYKSAILPFWKFKNEEVAKKSSKKILSLFNRYKKVRDFVGMDMARKFLQMGFTRARRYANHPSGRKYEETKSSSSKKVARPQAADWATNEKAKAAKVFYAAYSVAKSDGVYLELTAAHKKLSLNQLPGEDENSHDNLIEAKLIASMILRFAKDRGRSKTSCPSEVAREMSPEHWRSIMPEVNRITERMRDAGKIVILQKGKIKRGVWKGPIRFRIK